MTDTFTPMQRVLGRVTDSWMPTYSHALHVVCSALVNDDLDPDLLDPAHYSTTDDQPDPWVVLVPSVRDELAATDYDTDHLDDEALNLAVLGLWAIAEGCWESGETDMPLVGMGGRISARWGSPVTFHPTDDMLRVGATWARMTQGYDSLVDAARDVLLGFEAKSAGAA